MSSITTNNYQTILNSLKDKIREARLRASINANKYLLIVYWEIGNAISKQEIQEGWGAKIVETLAHDLKSEFPDMNGLSPRNLRYMRNFATAYPDFKNFHGGDVILQQPVAKLKKSGVEPILQPPVAKLKKSVTQAILQLPVAKLKPELLVQQLIAQIPWTHNVVLLDRVKDFEHRIFYIQKIIENNWSRNVLVFQIERKLHERQGNAITNFENTLPHYQSDLARETLKNPYLFDFLSFGEEVQERELEKALILHIKKFLLELGRGFAYVGNQYNIEVEDDDFFLDLLFYNYHLHCFVVFELKVGRFKPDYAGKLNFYINTVDEQIKGIKDKRTIGVLLCKTPNKTVIKYALKGIKAPIGVADYELAQALPYQLKGEMPTIKELERELENESEKLLKPKDKKLNNLKELISGLKYGELTEKRNPQNTLLIFQKVLLPLKKQLAISIADISKMFKQTEITLWTGIKGHHTEKAAKDYLIKNKHCGEFRIEVKTKGFKKAGIKAFDGCRNLNIILNEYIYTVECGKKNQKPLYEKLYNQILTKTELNVAAENFCEILLDDITAQVERIKKQKPKSEIIKKRVLNK